jgi:hypothetical protein
MTMVETERTATPNRPEGPVDYLVWFRHPNHSTAGPKHVSSVLLPIQAYSIPEAIAKTREEMPSDYTIMAVYVGIPVAGLPGTYR